MNSNKISGKIENHIKLSVITFSKNQNMFTKL